MMFGSVFNELLLLFLVISPMTKYQEKGVILLCRIFYHFAHFRAIMDSEIKKHISAIEQFKLCNNDKDRVKLMLNNIDESFHVTSECPFGRKSPEESEKYRNSGNLLFNSISPDLEEVLKLYSKSILYAPPGSEHLSLAYANRSAVLFRGKYYKECLEDISRALESGYPDSLKPKLLIRRVTCNYALTGNVDFETDEGLIEARALIKKLPVTSKIRKIVEDTLNNPEKITSVGRQVNKACPKYQPEMKGKNPHLPGASDAIALRYSEEYGRHLVATRNIHSGEVLLIEKPCATIVSDEWLYCICSHCVKRTWNGIPCDNCVHAMFCSAGCKRAAWEEYHNVECEILGFMKILGAEGDILMGLRMTLKAIKEAGSVEALRKRLKELDSVKISDVEIPINPNSYETFYFMADNPERQELEKLMSYSSTAGKLSYLLAARTNLFGERVIGSLQAVKDSEELLFVASFMSKSMRIASNGMLAWKVDSTNLKRRQILTLIPVFSFLNHRCYDAAESFRFNEDVILVTHVPISEGDQVFTHYSEDYKKAPRNLRNKYLNFGWKFDCNCLACKDNWSASTGTSWTDQDLPPSIKEELYNELRKFKYPSIEETSDLLEIVQGKEQVCRYINFVYPRVKKPCINVEFAVDIISQIYSILSSMMNPRFVHKL